MTVTDLFWLFLIFSWFVPVWQRWRVLSARQAILRLLQRGRGSRIITLIHRQESMSLLGFLPRRFIDIEDSEQVLRAIRSTPKDVPVWPPAPCSCCAWPQAPASRPGCC
mgnify:CR=1 FL=1